MPSTWVARRPRAAGGTSYRVMFRTGGRESVPRYAGAFPTMREALIRKAWVAGELAAMRVPDIGLVATPTTKVTIADQAARWKASRVDVSDGTMQTYVVAINRLERFVGTVAIADLDAARVAELVAELHGDGLKRQTIRKTISVLGMILDHAGVQPNPTRDKITIKLPREERRHVEPPTADHIEAVIRDLPKRYVLPLLVLDDTGMRVGELEALTFGDVDEPRGRWRVAAGVSKTGRPRWIEPDPLIFAAVMDLVPRDDRTPGRRVFQGITGDRMRTQLQRSCTAAGVPMFSPHDLRHRRVSLLHLRGMPWVRIGELVGHDDIVTTARTYTHVVADERELDYQDVLL